MNLATETSVVENTPGVVVAGAIAVLDDASAKTNDSSTKTNPFSEYVSKFNKPPLTPVVHSSAFPSFERGDELEVACAVLSKFSPYPELVVHDEGALHVYNAASGEWVRKDETAVFEVVASFAGAPVPGSAKGLKVTQHLVKGANGLARLKALKSGFFASAPHGVAFRNGFVRVQNGVIELLPHSPDHKTRSVLDFDYNPALPHPMLDAHFEDVFADAAPADRAGRVQMLQEFLGTCLIGRATDYETCLALIGDGGNGKGETVEVFRSLFPTSRVTAIAPHEWSKPFALSGLVGALANFVDETPTTDLVGSEVFKKVVSGNPCNTERKYEHGFTFRPRAGHIFSINTTPGIPDHSNAFWRRILVVRFDRDMKNAPTNRVRYGSEIARTERAAIAAWAIEGAARLQRQGGKYTEPESSAKAKADWRRESDSVESWVSERTYPCGDESDSQGTTAGVLYDNYHLWAKRRGFKAVSLTTFGKRMGKLCERVRTRDANYYRIELRADESPC